MLEKLLKKGKTAMDIKALVARGKSTFEGVPRDRLAWELADALEGTNAVVEAAQWQDISTAPKDGTTFLGWMPDHPNFRVPQIAICSWDDWDRGMWLVNNHAIESQPTHWRPLLSPPDTPAMKALAALDAPKEIENQKGGDAPMADAPKEGEGDG